MAKQGDKPKPDSTNPQGGADPATEPTFTKAEWEQKRRGELADMEMSKLVEKVVALEGDNRTLRQRQTPEGSTVLDADQAAEWQAFQELGKASEIKESLEAGKSAITERDGLKRAAEFSAAAEVAKAKTSVLTERLELNSLTVKVQGEGEEKAVHVYDSESKDLGELKAYAEKNWADYVPALFPSTASTGKPVNGQAGNRQSEGSTTGVKGFLENKNKASTYVDPLQAQGDNQT